MELLVISGDWALNVTNLASEGVEQQFLAHIADKPLVEPPSELDVVGSWNPVKLDIDIMQYNEALAKQELGMNNAQQQALLTRFSPIKKILLVWPSIVIESGY
ncbi:hypothetical protein BDR05DRAFT_1006925 [Suillus weaverae]|nr:hypothetical protein BDR05DRAFT_1006925 [Suillus weaverae]